MINGLKMIAQKYFSNFKPEKNPIFSKKHMKVLKKLSLDKSIRITSPDKGKGLVIMRTQDYHSKLETILSDCSKFSLCHETEEKLVQRLELKLNTFLRKIKSTMLFLKSNINNCMHQVPLWVPCMAWRKLTSLIFLFDQLSLPIKPIIIILVNLLPPWFCILPTMNLLLKICINFQMKFQN